MDILREMILPCVYSFIASIAFGVQFNIRFRHMLAAGIGAVLTQLIFIGFEMSGLGQMICYFFAASAVSVYAELMARRLHVPVNMYLVIGIIPLVPGGNLYNTMISFVGGDIDSFSHQFAEAVGIAGSIAMGVFAVSALMRLIGMIVKQTA